MPDEHARLWTRPRATLIAVIVLVAIGVRVGWIAYANVSPLDGRFDDSVFYFKAAQSLAHDFSFRDLFGHLTAQWPPGYPLVLSGVFATVGTHVLAVKALNVGLSAATVLLTYVLAARAFDVRVGLVSALLLALAPGHAYFATLILSEVLFGFGFLSVTALMVWWTVDRRRARWEHLLVLGLATGCLTLVRSEAVFLPMTFAVLWKVLLVHWRPALRYAAIFGLGFVLVLTPWTVRNGLRFHAFIPLRDNPHGALANGLDRRYPHRIDRIGGPAPPLSETLGYMERHPWELVPLQVEKLQNLYRDDSDGIYWLQYTKPLLSAREARRWSLVADWSYFGIGGCALLAMPLLLRAPGRRRAVFAYVMVAWTAIETITWPETRYHYPLTPLICMFAAWVLCGPRSWRRADQDGLRDAVQPRAAAGSTGMSVAQDCISAPS